MVWLRRRRLRSLGWRRIFGGEIPSPSPYCAFLLPRHSQDWPGCCLERGSQPPHIPILDPTLAMARPPPNLDSPTPPRAGPRHVCAPPLSRPGDFQMFVDSVVRREDTGRERERERDEERRRQLFVFVFPPSPSSARPSAMFEFLTARKKVFPYCRYPRRSPSKRSAGRPASLLSCWTKCDEPWPPPPPLETLPPLLALLCLKFPSPVARRNVISQKAPRTILPMAKSCTANRQIIITFSFLRNCIGLEMPLKGDCLRKSCSGANTFHSDRILIFFLRSTMETINSVVRFSFSHSLSHTPTLSEGRESWERGGPLHRSRTFQALPLAIPEDVVERSHQQP